MADQPAHPTPKPSFAIHTIGYGGRTMDEFLAVLQQYAVDYLIDVRTSPYSRYKPEFSRAVLEKALASHKIRYVYMGDLLGGMPADPDCFTDGKVDYAKIRQTTPYLNGIERLRHAHDQCLHVVLMCSEGKPEQCHRSKLIGESLTQKDIPVLHIDEEGRLCSHAEIIFRLTDGQLSLFGQTTFTSRKRYGPVEGDDDGM
ncbi:MAG: DUF488 domain-containing protein [Caldilineaceae bacterium]|nr:DUF488 domain-containing protein [Caldilineaceae bacterium]